MWIACRESENFTFGTTGNKDGHVAKLKSWEIRRTEIYLRITVFNCVIDTRRRGYH